jgi:hypothetical protein
MQDSQKDILLGTISLGIALGLAAASFYLQDAILVFMVPIFVLAVAGFGFLSRGSSGTLRIVFRIPLFVLAALGFAAIAVVVISAFGYGA